METVQIQTLIELYDERPLENVLAAEMFHPRRVVYVCPDAVASDGTLRDKLTAYFQHRGLNPELIFLPAQVYDTDDVLQALHRTVLQYPGCALDITGGTDAALFAAGRLSAELPVPVFTFSRRRNRFYEIQNAPFAARSCELRYTVEDFFRMAGGSMRPGRVDNGVLPAYHDTIVSLFDVFLAHRRRWNRVVAYLQRISQEQTEGASALSAGGAYTVKADRGARISAPEQALHALAQAGLISRLEILAGESVRFRFRDGQIRTWLRDVGSPLELHLYRACVDSGLFDDVRLSAVVDWEGNGRRDDVTNELDVVCTRGLIPVFFSCKTGEVKTEALNELAVLRDRFGGQMARAAIVTSTRGNAAMRNRAGELDIDVIDLSDLPAERLEHRLHRLLADTELN